MLNNGNPYQLFHKNFKEKKKLFIYNFKLPKNLLKSATSVKTQNLEKTQNFDNVNQCKVSKIRSTRNAFNIVLCSGEERVKIRTTLNHLQIIPIGCGKVMQTNLFENMPS